MNIRQFFHIVELRTKIVSISAFIIAFTFAYKSKGSIDYTLFWLTLIPVLCIDMGTTAFNNFFGWLSGTDKKETNKEKDKVIITENVAPLSAFIVGILLWIIALLFSIILIAKTSIIILPIGIACVLFAFLYSAGPLPIASTPVGELFAGFFLGFLLVNLSYFCLGGTITNTTWLLGLPSYFSTAAILSVNNLCDIEGDRNSGRKTFPILFGLKAGKIYLFLEIICTYIAMILLKIFAITSTSIIVLLPGLILSILLFLTMNRKGFSHSTKSKNMKTILLIHTINSITVIMLAIL